MRRSKFWFWLAFAIMVVGLGALIYYVVIYFDVEQSPVQHNYARNAINYFAVAMLFGCSMMFRHRPPWS